MIHASAHIDPQAKLGRNVAVGPNCFIGAGVVLGDDCVLHHNVTIMGGTVAGPQNVFFPGAVIGAPPQDLKYKGGLTQVLIGEDNVFRELVTVHAGTEVAGGVTRIGSHNRFLVGVHIAHDTVVGSDCILSNYVQLAGHVHLEDKVTIGGIVGIHHFTTIGTLSFVGGLTRIVADVPPYMIIEGNPARIRGFNETGMRRWSFTDQQVKGIRAAYRALFARRGDKSGASMMDRLAALEARTDLNGEVRYLCESVRRSLDHGVYGRQLERFRKDTDADRKAYYNQQDKNQEQGT